MTIRERLAKQDPNDAGRQRDLIVSYVKLNEVSGDKAYIQSALTVALTMQWAGTLAPADEWMVEVLQKRASLMLGSVAVGPGG